ARSATARKPSAPGRSCSWPASSRPSSSPSRDPRPVHRLGLPGPSRPRDLRHPRPAAGNDPDALRAGRLGRGLRRRAGADPAAPGAHRAGRPALGGARRRLLRAAPADPLGGHPACAPDQQRGTGRRRPRHGRRGGRGEGAPHRRGPRGGRPPPRHARAARLAEGHVASAPRPHRADRRPVSAHAPYHHCRAGLSPARENIMCGILGVVSRSPVNQLLYDGLLLMQHRGQDAAGIATAQNKTFNMHKGNGMVRDVFRTRNMRSLPGNSGIAHVRYPTAGSASNSEEAQPFYVNAPFGITLAHNGNLTNSEELTAQMFLRDRRHINTDSDSEVLRNVLANELQSAASGVSLDANTVFRAVSAVHERVRGAYAVVAEIAGYGVLGFRDPHGIRPLCYGVAETDAGPEYMIASESVALEGTGFRMVRDVQPGEAVFIDLDGNFQSR